MKIHVSRLPEVVSEYFETVLMPAASTRGSLWTFGTGFVGGLISRNSAIMVDRYLPVLQQLSIIDSQGMVDIDLLYNEATKAMNKAHPTIMGYTADQSDVEKLRNIMISKAGSVVQPTNTPIVNNN